MIDIIDALLLIIMMLLQRHISEVDVDGVVIVLCCIKYNRSSCVGCWACKARTRNKRHVAAESEITPEQNIEIITT